MATLPESQRASRIALVDEHVRVENEHDIDATMRTFGATPTSVINGDSLDGHENIRGFYDMLFGAFPDLDIDVKHRHVTDESVTLEVVVNATHKGPFNGVAATGRRVAVPICAVFTFDDQERLVGERAYFDTGVIMQQIGAAS